MPPRLVEIDVAQAHSLAHVGGVEAVEGNVHAIGPAVEDRGEDFVGSPGAPTAIPA